MALRYGDSCQETEMPLEEAIFCDHVHRQGRNGHFSLGGFLRAPLISKTEVIGPRVNSVLRVHSSGICLLCQEGVGFLLSDWCPDVECLLVHKRVAKCPSMYPIYKLLTGLTF